MCVQKLVDGFDVKCLFDGLLINWGKWGFDDEVGVLNYL